MRVRLVVFSVAVFFAVAGYSAMAFAKSPQYMGNTGCKCHKSEQADWAQSTHGKAMDLLFAAKRTKTRNLAMKKAKLDDTKDYDKDEKCLKCHTVGYGEQGGYEDEKSAEELKGVGCEMCHGAGSEFRKIHASMEETFTRAQTKAVGATYGSEDKKVCLKCHDNPASPFNSKLDKKYAFNHTERLKLDKAWHKIYPVKYKH